MEAAAAAATLFNEIETAAALASDAVRESVADVIADRRIELVSAFGSNNPARVFAATSELRRAMERALCGCAGQTGS